MREERGGTDCDKGWVEEKKREADCIKRLVGEEGGGTGLGKG